jgi:hypothetical protein
MRVVVVKLTSSVVVDVLPYNIFFSDQSLLCIPHQQDSIQNLRIHMTVNKLHNRHTRTLYRKFRVTRVYSDMEWISDKKILKNPGKDYIFRACG